MTVIDQARFDTECTIDAFVDAGLECRDRGVLSVALDELFACLRRNGVQIDDPRRHPRRGVLGRSGVRAAVSFVSDVIVHRHREPGR